MEALNEAIGLLIDDVDLLIDDVDLGVLFGDDPAAIPADAFPAAALHGEDGVAPLHQNDLLVNQPGILLAPHDDNPNPWKLVISRKFGRVRRAQPEVYPPAPEEFITTCEFEWTPKVRPLRAVRKWAQVRQGGCVGTPDGGIAVLTYPLVVPAGERI